MRNGQNKLRAADRSVHDWYRFVLSFPPHLVRDYATRFNVGSSDTVLDPFCGTGTTLVECKKLGIRSIGIESNPMAYFASMVKTEWSIDSGELSHYADTVASVARKELRQQGYDDSADAPLFSVAAKTSSSLRSLSPEQLKLLLKNSISPLPLHKTLTLLDVVDRHGNSRERQYGRIALATALVNRFSNLKFGPEVGVGKIKQDAPVLEGWVDGMRAIARDLDIHKDQANVPAHVLQADSREAGRLLEPESIDVVITSPPYPNEKDYTRTTRLESVVLGLIRDKKELRGLKQNLVRSNTRGVYKSDTDDRAIMDHIEIQRIAKAIEKRRIELGKTSGFERLYPRVTQLYFGGIFRHLASLRSVLKPGAKLAYVVGDQASYLRIMIRTGRLLADLAESLGYKVLGIDLFRTRQSTISGAELREEVVLLEWSGI